MESQPKQVLEPTMAELLMLSTYDLSIRDANTAKLRHENMLQVLNDRLSRVTVNKESYLNELRCKYPNWNG